MRFRESTSILESHVAVILSSETLKMDQVLHLYRNRRQTLGLARSATLSSIIMRLCWVLVAIYLSCRAFFRRPISCSCRRFVSDCVSFSSCNQLVIIGPRMKWRIRQLSFPLANWYGDVIWIFDPGIIGNQIDKEGESKRCFMQTPVHSMVLRQGQRIWWREITLSLISRIPWQNFALDIIIDQGIWKVIIDRGIWKDISCCFQRTPLRISTWTEIQKMVLIISTNMGIGYNQGRCHLLLLEMFDGKRCNRWIATNDRFKVYWSFVNRTISKQDGHVRLKKKTNEEDNRFDNLLACKAYEIKRRLIHWFDCIFSS